MRPYYEHGGITIYHGDCREIAPSLSADIVMTDPPYSSGGFQEAARSAGSLTGRHKERGESILLDNLSSRGYERLMREVLRWLNQADEIFLFTDWRMWTATFDVVESAGWRVRNMLVWDKMQMGMGQPWRNQHELILYGKRTAAQILDGKRGNVLRFPRSSREYHPTEKPVDLIATLLSNTIAGSVIDPFMGSGTTLIAAKNQHRCAIGIEADERYCEIAAQRLSQEVLNLGGVA